MASIDQASALLLAASDVVFFTGAGISAESGIPIAPAHTPATRVMLKNCNCR